MILSCLALSMCCFDILRDVSRILLYTFTLQVWMLLMIHRKATPLDFFWNLIIFQLEPGVSVQDPKHGINDPRWYPTADSRATAMSLFLGFDSSTQSLKATAIDASDLQVGYDPVEAFCSLENVRRGRMRKESYGFSHIFTLLCTNNHNNAHKFRMGCFKLMGFHGTRFNSMWLWMTQSFLTSRSPLWRLWQPSSWQVFKRYVINFDKDLPQLRTNFGSMTWNTHSYTPHFSVFVRCFPKWLLPHVFLFINQGSDMFKGRPCVAPCSLWSACGWGISRPREGCLPAAVPSGSPLRCWCGSRRFRAWAYASVRCTKSYRILVCVLQYITILWWCVYITIYFGVYLYLYPMVLFCMFLYVHCITIVWLLLLLLLLLLRLLDQPWPVPLCRWKHHGQALDMILEKMKADQFSFDKAESVDGFM